MPIPFLRQVAQHYLNPSFTDLKDTVFVFPSRRSLVHFRNEIKAVSGDPSLKVHGTTINDFFYRIHGTRPTERLRLVLELYEVYKSVNPKAESLDEFIFWGRTMIADFDNIDKYLADAKALFVNISDYKAMQDTLSYLTEEQRHAIEQFIAHFRDRNGRITVLPGAGKDIKARFLQVWDLLYPLYEGFKKRLDANGMAYEGMVYRSFAERLCGGADIREIVNGIYGGERRFVFVGLNALNECEKTVLRALRDASMAEFAWDFSSKEIRSRENKASLFLTKNIREFPQAFSIDASPLRRPEVTVVSVPSAIGQAKVAPQFLAEAQGDPEETVIVLPDESLLMPLLSAIPDSYDTVNVTMGYPMKRSAVYSLMKAVAQLQLSAREKDGVTYFHHKAVTDILTSSLVKAILTDEEKTVAEAVRCAAKLHIPQQDLTGGDTLDTIFRPVISDIKGASAEQNHRTEEYLRQVIMHIGTRTGDSGDELVELDFAKRYHEAVSALSAYDLPVLPATHLSTLDRMLFDESVPFDGEPLRGLQVMGALETRALDFRNVAILSANEDVFPHRSADNSFIPPEMRRAFGLPTLEYQDAVWAYYFYRLIQRAEKVWLIYDSRTEGLLSGEESRYIKQLEYAFGFNIRRFTATAPVAAPATAGPIPKTEDDVKTLREKRLSASALQNYLCCPAKFYYHTVKGLRTDDDVAESVDAAMLGTIFHEVMQKLYSGRKSVSQEDIRQLLRDEKTLRGFVHEGIKNQMKVLDVEGRNLVVEEVLLEYVKGTLRHDLSLLGAEGAQAFRIIGLERYLETEINGFKFIGFADRIDSYRDGEVRIVDYKTGHVENDDIVITAKNAESVADKLFGESNTGRPKIALQMYLYGVFAHKNILRQGETVVNSVYSVGKLLTTPLPDMPECPEFTTNVDGRLKALLDEIADTAIPFRRTEDKFTCEHCDFRDICGR